MADDETIEEPFDEDVDAEAEIDPGEIDPEALEAAELGEDAEFAEGEEFEGGGETEDTDQDEDEDAETDGPVRKAVPAGEDEDDDDDMLAPDDVEADLDTILKDRLVAADEEANDDEEEPEERGEAADRLQPKRADEQLCPQCFLLVRQTAPGCPVGDDECPLFG